MKLATWNVNSLTVRLPQVLDWLNAHTGDQAIDVLALQETKTTDDKFPRAEIEAAGYHVVFFGQKTYNGVALISRHLITDVVHNIPGFADDMARVITGTVNGKAFTAQIERGTPKNPLALRVQHNGTRIDALVVSPRMATLHRMMPFKSPPDMSRFVLSPMPGLLSQVLVAPGQKVQAGERVAVIEAMKMENVLFAAADGVVKKVVASQGESLTVDQMIVEFA